MVRPPSLGRPWTLLGPRGCSAKGHISARSRGFDWDLFLQDRRILEVTAFGGQMEVSTRAVVAADGLGSGLMAQAGVPSLVPLNGSGEWWDWVGSFLRPSRVLTPA